MADTQTTIPSKAKFIFWGIMTGIGLVGIIAGAILLGLDGNSLFWLPTALGIALFAISITFLVYLIVIEVKRKHVRSRGI